ncbi:anti-ECFsigma factor, ChrR [Fibrella aestuarina BUZ 2]|uniref:Anti-ECFsigma factor, ChrR n=1 Tax=Fibrella aestuarina BUZ 2 TaxID=1166018 RepID=I0K222_9BACT|nr:zf-HC2 domain-containing protein [Fibrella aestuarina]CCG98175.1 anti-ECFsigma factor, ChrR [Fibrella aestuarina BUZ 2]
MNNSDNHITCQTTQHQLPDWLSGELPAPDRVAFDAHVAACPDCQQEVAALQQLWQRLGDRSANAVPEPGPQVRTQFYAMLDQFVAEQPTVPTGTWARLTNWLQHQTAAVWLPRLAYSLLLVSVGVLAGYWLQRQQSPDLAYRQQIDTLSTQVQAMRQMMMLSLLENPSATERLRAVSYTKDINEVDGHVIDALLMTLNNDPNVNVRLVTLEALADLARDPRVREGLVQSLSRQDSPLVQVALADVMVKLQEKRSLKPMRQLLQQPNTNDLVKSKLEQTIKELS